MKMKSFAILAVSSLLAASYTYALPVSLVNDVDKADTVQQQPADDGFISQADNNDPSSMDSNTTPVDDSSGGAADTSGNNDPNSLDSATGDDDF